ncbi:protein BCCIP homolog [Phlebotomus argentipes]|uniref:protein BCCIP homolog n=1 Tax=Phlebotomus argentipes TaxID=94469 RepID=UPI002892A954|nr:protein BCCIP homolog [Phlebotomus argentipes]
MSGSKVPKVSKDEEVESDASMDDIYSGNEKLQVDFEGRNPIDSDFDGIKQMLNQLFLNATINTNELTDLLIAQNYVGSVIWQSDVDDEEDESDMDDSGLIFGITSVLNISQKLEKESIKQIRQYLLEKSQSAADAAGKLKEILEDVDHPVGFLVNERFINIPPMISIPLLDSLQKEINRAVTKNMPFKFEYFLMILKYYKTDAKKKSKNFDEVNFSNPEEEVIAKDAILSFDYSVAEADTGLTGNWLEDDVALTPYRKVIVFEARKLPEIVGRIKEFVE